MIASLGYFLQVNLKYGLAKTVARTGHEKDTCTACAGTMILEFAALSRLTGDPVFEVHFYFSYQITKCMMTYIIVDICLNWDQFLK